MVENTDEKEIVKWLGVIQKALGCGPVSAVVGERRITVGGNSEPDNEALSRLGRMDQSVLIARLGEIWDIARGGLISVRTGNVIKTKAAGTLTPEDVLNEIADLVNALMFDLEFERVDEV